MSLFRFLYTVLALWSLSWVAASSIPQDLVVRSYNDDAETVEAVRRAVSSARQLVGRDTVVKNSTSLDKSWDGAVLLKL